MSDEQPIFLDPDDDLNRVTERLAATTTQRVVIIVPQQTEMRSNVFWRLLYSRARGMGKEVTVVSADRQMRSIAKVAGFRVADAQASSSPGKDRPSRFVRSPFESRQTRQSRSQGPRTSTGPTNSESRSRSVQTFGPGESERRGVEIRENRERATLRDKRGKLAGKRPSAQLDTAQETASQHTWSEAESNASQAEEMLSRQGPGRDDEYDRPYGYSIGASQAAPLQAQPKRERSNEQDQDPYSPDYKISKKIKESWQSGLASQPPSPGQFSPGETGRHYVNEELPQPDQGYQNDEADSTFQADRVSEFSVPPSAFDPASSAPGPGTYPEQGTPRQDPFAALEDRSSVSLPEQHAATHVDDIDEGIPDIAQKPDELPNVHKIEDLGEDISSVTTQKIPPEMYAGDPEEDEERRHFGSRPRGSRSGGLSRRQQNDFDDQDRLAAPGEDRQAGSYIVPVQPVMPGPAPRPARPSGGLPAARGSSGALPTQQRTQRNGTPPGYGPNYQQPGQTSRMGTPSGPVATQRAAQPAQQGRAMTEPARRGSRIAMTALLILVLLFLAGAGLFYFGTSATVTLTVPSQSISLSAIKLTASVNSLDKTQNPVPSQVLTFPASQPGSGTATGTTPHGGAAASGSATFTNNGSKPVHLPTNTTISTAAGPGSVGSLFVTTVDVVIPANASYPIPIQAKNPGAGGDAGAGKITVIPADSLTAIAATNGVSVASLNLSVTNPAAVTGGGATNAPAATQNDIAALKIKLHQQIQTEVKRWLHNQLHDQDQHGTLMPDVLGSAKPLPQEVLTQAPAVGQPLSSRTITGTLTVQIKVLVVRTADLQAAAAKQLEAGAMKKSPQYTVTTAKAPVKINKVASSSSKDGTMLTITLNATAQTELYIDKNKLSSSLAGQPKDQAQNCLSSQCAGYPGIQNVDIAVNPSFINLMPLRPEQIQIIVLPGSPAPTQNGTPNG